MLAVDAGIDRTYVSRLERGLENPSVAVLEKLARALSSNIEEFFTAPRAGEGGAPPRVRRRHERQAKRPSCKRCEVERVPVSPTQHGCNSRGSEIDAGLFED
jgi:transcriptional regulator with XRE-family HTH domain